VVTSRGRGSLITGCVRGSLITGCVRGSLITSRVRVSGGGAAWERDSGRVWVVVGHSACRSGGRDDGEGRSLASAGDELCRWRESQRGAATTGKEVPTVPTSLTDGRAKHCWVWRHC
jgi:hypothetical protein